MSDPSLPGTPGTGPIPEPEAEGFRDEQVEQEKQRLVDEQTEALQRSKEAKDFYTGKPEEPPPPEGGEGETGGTSRSTSHKSTSHTTPPKGSSSKS
jgi:hypothetical protein